MPTSFVAGATGYVGREVVRALTGHGFRTVAHVRPDSSRLAEWCERFSDLGAEVDTTPWEPAPLAARLRELEPDAVFCLIGTTRKRGDSYEEVDYGLTKMLVDAAVAAGAPRFVYLSSAGVGPSARGAYLRARWRAEEVVRHSGLPYTIARPSFITGSDRDDSRPMERVGAAVGDGALALVGLLGARRLRSRFRSTTSTVLGPALARLAFDPAAAMHEIEGDELR